MSIDQVDSYIGFDPAEPGSDRTVIAVHGANASDMASVIEGLRERGIEVVIIGGGGSGMLQLTGRSGYGDMATMLPSAELVESQFASFNTGSQDRLRDRWGRLKR